MTGKVKQWIMRGLAVAVMLAAPLLSGPPMAVILLLALPLMAESARVSREQAVFAVSALVLAAACHLVLARSIAWAALPWCLACGAMAWIPVREPVRRGAVWAGLTAAEICWGLWLLGQRYTGPLFDGLAWDAVQWIGQQENSAALLLQFYQMGLARLPEDLAKLPAVNLFGTLIMTEDVRREIMYSLRYTLSVTFQQLLPQGAVWWMGLNGLVCAVVPDVMRRQQGKQGMLPAFGQWKLGRQAHRLLTVLLVGCVLPLFADQPVIALMGQMCMAAFRGAYTVLGLCVMEGLMKRLGMTRTRRRVIMGISVVMASFVPFVIGVADRAFDFRTPRRERDEDDDNQGGYDE